MPAAEGYQIELSPEERERLIARIEEDYRSALTDHDRRMARFVSYYRRWRNRYLPNDQSAPDAPNFQVPLTKWHVLGKWAKEIDSLFGDDAEIVAVPHGPSDEANVRKISRYMTWRVFHSMRLVNPFAVFVFRKILFGRAHAYAPWVRDASITDKELPPEKGSILKLPRYGKDEQVDYEGPTFLPLWPDDLLVPAEEVNSIHEFSFVMRKYRETLDNMLRKDGKLYQGIGRKHYEALLNLARQPSQERDATEQGDEVKLEKDEGEGVVYQQGLSSREGIRIWEWHAGWRMLNKGAKDADEYDPKQRAHLRTDLVVRYSPDLKEIVGVQKLRQLYPTKRYPRPFVESALTRDGSYWCPGFGEILGEIEAEVTATNNLGVEAGQLSVGPVIFYRPATGLAAEQLKYEPRMLIPVDNPNDIREISFKADLSFVELYTNALLGYAERVGVSDLSLGRTQDRPNAPKTASGTIALLDEGNVRAALDVRVLREDMQDILQHFWELDRDLAGDEVFFRVTEEEADGLFETQDGGAKLTTAERSGRYDFHLQFATSTWNRELKRQRQLELYQLDLTNPLIATNPRALWHLANKIHEVFGDSAFSRLIPEPPDMELSIQPKEELSRMLQGEDVQVRPGDNDMDHITDHDRQLQRLKASKTPDKDAIEKLVRHQLAHMRQLQQKKMMQALAAEAAKGPAALQQQIGGLMPQENGSPGGEQISNGPTVQPGNAPGPAPGLQANGG